MIETYIYEDRYIIIPKSLYKYGFIGILNNIFIPNHINKHNVCTISRTCISVAATDILILQLLNGAGMSICYRYQMREPWKTDGDFTPT